VPRREIERESGHKRRGRPRCTGPDLTTSARKMSLAAVLDAATDDTLLAIAIALPMPADLLRLVLTCHAAAQRYYFTATSYSSAVPSGASGGTAAAQGTWSIIEQRYHSRRIEGWLLIEERRGCIFTVG
jgi:hypothetical protein